MKNKIVLVFGMIFIALLMFGLASATTCSNSINACCMISSAGYYELTQNITSNSNPACIKINTSNVILNGNWFNISEGNAGSIALNRHDNTTHSLMNLNNITIINIGISSWASSGGIIGNSANNSYFGNISMVNTSQDAMILMSAPNSNVTINNLAGFQIYSAPSNSLINFAGASNNITISNSNITKTFTSGTEAMIRFEAMGTNIKIVNNSFLALKNAYAIQFTAGCTSCNISGNHFRVNATSYTSMNINFAAASPNLMMYNNLFYGNSTGIYFKWTNSTNSSLNTTNYSDTNIAGGNRIGGNFYYLSNGSGLSQICLDNNNDQFCDSTISFNFGNLTDYLPLASSGRIIGLSPANNTASLENERVNFTAIYQASSVCISDVNASFKYDGVYYNPIETKSSNNYTFRYELLIPSITNNTETKLWSFNFSVVNNSNCEYSNQSEERTYRVSSIGLSGCAGIYNKTIMNFILKDEKEQTTTQMNNMSRIEAHIILISPTNSSFYKSYNISVINNTNLLICGQDVNYTNYKINATLIFEALNHVVENYYYDNFSITNLNIPQNVTLFDLATTQSTSYLVTVQDRDYLYLSNAVVEVWRYYIGEGVFKIVEMAKTDEHGQTRLHLVSEDATYRILIRKGNQLLWTTTDFLAICQATPCQININIGQEQGQFYDPYTKDNIAYTLDFNEGTREVTLTFNTLDGSSANVGLNLTKVYNDEGVCYNSTSLAGGTLVCSVPLALNNVSYNVLFSKDGQLIDFDSFNLNPDAQLYFGDTGIIMAGLTVLALSLMAISNGVLVMVFAVIGLITASSLLILKLPYGTLIYLIIAIVILIIKFTKKQDGV